MKKKKLIKLLLIPIILIVIVIWLINPLIRPAWMIRLNMLFHTPLGTSMEDVLIFVESNENWDATVRHEIGFSNRRGDRIGIKSIRVSLGVYGLTYVSVFYGFDEDEKLVGVRVSKEVSW
ncbi:MAG: hypothetical protein LBD23_10570 [Oscillospiraceae bacterium]|jgi:hypothetical protein|nr:hypothetical protein [Oscillospiraceae bacterium]